MHILMWGFPSLAEEQAGNPYEMQAPVFLQGHPTMHALALLHCHAHFLRATAPHLNKPNNSHPLLPPETMSNGSTQLLKGFSINID